VSVTAPGAGTPTGTVQFKIDGVNFGSPVAVDGTGHATSGSTTSLAVGSHSVTATYSGDANFLGSIGSLAGGQTVTYAPPGTECLGSPGHTILQPINEDGSSVFRQGSTVPAKFRVCDAFGNSIGTPGLVVSFRLVQVTNGTITTVDEAVDSTTPDSAFRWSSTDQQWIFNISTKSLSKNRTYYYVITLNDGTTIDFHFGLK
jgi:hypothetical protein